MQLCGRLIRSSPLVSTVKHFQKQFSNSFSIMAAEQKVEPLIDDANRINVVCLFDVDGTLSASRLEAEKKMWDLLKVAKNTKGLYVGFVGGSDFVKQQEQLGGKEAPAEYRTADDDSKNVRAFFNYCFSENGLVAYRNGVSISDHSLKKELSEDEIKVIVNWWLINIAKLDIPVKRGTFVEFRTGMINVCPVGRNCSQEERVDFYRNVDKNEKGKPETHAVRLPMVNDFYAYLAKEHPDLRKKLKCSIGGQISVDIFPEGWDKTYCLQFVNKEAIRFDEIHFFGDKAYPGGNDYEIWAHPDTIGHGVKSPDDTIKFMNAIIERLNKDNGQIKTKEDKAKLMKVRQDEWKASGDYKAQMEAAEKLGLKSLL